MPVLIALVFAVAFMTVTPPRQQSAQPRKVTLYKPHAGQLRIHRSKARFRVVACGRRFGKTLMACNEIARFALEHKNVTCAWVAPSYRQSKIAYRLIRKALKPAISYKSDSELRLEFYNGATITFYSSDNYDALRGNGFHFIVLDECADINELAWTEVLRPTLSDTNGRALFIGTPKGRNFFFRLFSKGDDPNEPEWANFNAATAANPYIRASEIESAKRELPEDTFKQEYLAVFLEESAGVFRGIDACIRGILNKLIERITKHYYVLGWDPAKYEDYSVVTVIDCHTKEVVYWERINQIDYTVQLEMVANIAAKFHANVLMDMTGVGDPLLEQLKVLGRKRGFKADGFLFTNASKKALIENLQLGIQNRDISFPDIPVMLNELRIFEYRMTKARQLSYSAPKGMHDDAVISLALAYLAASQPRGPRAWSVDEETTTRTLEMTELPENRQYQMVEVEAWQEEGEWIDIDAA